MAYSIFKPYTTADLVNDYFDRYLEPYLITFFDNGKGKPILIEQLHFIASQSIKQEPKVFQSFLQEELPKEVKIHAALMKICKMVHGEFEEEDMLFKYKHCVTDKNTNISNALAKKIESWMKAYIFERKLMLFKFK